MEWCKTSIIVLFLTLGTTGVTVAQQPASSHGRPVMLVLKERFTRDAIGAIVRRSAGPGGRDIIAVRRDDLSPELLDAVLGALSSSRTKHGNTPNSQITIQYPHGLSVRPIDASRKRFLARKIAELEARAPEQVPEVGLARAITLPDLP